MPHVPTAPDTFGIRSLFAWRPETAAPLTALAETLLRGPSTLPRGDRELIAAYVSALNGCEFCRRSHGAIAARQLDGGEALVARVLADGGTIAVGGKLGALLALAAQVQKGGRAVSD